VLELTEADQHWVRLATIAWSGVDRGASSPFLSVRRHSQERAKMDQELPVTQSWHWSRFLHGSRRPGTGGSFISLVLKNRRI